MRNIVVIGVSGGIGGEFIKQLSAREDVSTIYAFSRTPVTLSLPKVDFGYINLLEEDSILAAAEHASRNSPIDLVIVATGVLHDGNLQPEKAIAALSAEKFQHLFAANTIGPALILKHFAPKLNKNSTSIMAILSARIGSISDNYLGGWYAYRASKSALNMLIKTASIEMKRTLPKSIIVGLHPGTVDTKLSKPFQNRLSPDQIFSPESAASKLLLVIDHLQSSDSGKLLDYAHDEVLP